MKVVEAPVKASVAGREARRLYGQGMSREWIARRLAMPLDAVERQTTPLLMPPERLAALRTAARVGEPAEAVAQRFGLHTDQVESITRALLAPRLILPDLSARRHELGMVLRRARHHAGLSSEQAAKRAGVAPVTVRHWEAGQNLTAPAALVDYGRMLHAYPALRDEATCLIVTVAAPWQEPAEVLASFDVAVADEWRAGGLPFSAAAARLGLSRRRFVAMRARGVSRADDVLRWPCLVGWSLAVLPGEVGHALLGGVS